MVTVFLGAVGVLLDYSAVVIYFFGVKLDDTAKPGVVGIFGIISPWKPQYPGNVTGFRVTLKHSG